MSEENIPHASAKPGERPIRLQSRPSKAQQTEESDKDPIEKAKRLLRGMMIVGKAPELPPDHLWPNLWSATAYDSFKYSGLLDKASAHVLSKLVGENPETLSQMLGAFHRGASKPFVPHELEHPEPPHPRYRRKGAAVTPKDRFIRAHREEFRAKEAEVRADIAESMEKAAFDPLSAGLGVAGAAALPMAARGVENVYRHFRPKTTVDHVVDAVKGVGNLATNPDVHSAFGKARDWARDHSGAVGLGAAGALGAGLAYKHMRGQGSLGDQHMESFHHAMRLFPELRQEDPEKIDLLFRSATQVAPNVSTNPLLLGTWMKGLARGYSETHLSTEDLRRLQELEVNHVGGPARKQDTLGTVGGVLGAGAGVASLLGHMRSGQGRDR